MLNSHFDSVWRAGRRMGLPDAQAEDNAQETFAIAARKLDRVEHGRERAFLLGVAVRLAVNARRRVAERLELLVFNREDHENPDGTPLAEELLEQKRQRAFLDQILESMSDTFRQVLTLYEIEELTLPEIAMALEIPEGTAASRLRRARKEFRRKIARFSASAARFEEWP
jgi:RNA polymerase sigma-70 factor (ECF subfamily)